MKEILGAAYHKRVRGRSSGFYKWLPWRLLGAKRRSLAKQDEIFVELYPIYEDLDNYVFSGEDSYRWSALRSTVRAVQTGYGWSDGLGESSSGSVGRVRGVMSKYLVSAIASGDGRSLGVARDALERFLTYLIDSSSEDLKGIVRMFQCLGFSGDN